MQKLTILTCLAVAGMILGGCVDIKADVSRFSLGGDPRAETPAPEASSDPRTADQLKRENDQLRQRLTVLERRHQDLQLDIQRQEDVLDDLERQKDRLEDERDRYKDALDD